MNKAILLGGFVMSGKTAMRDLLKEIEPIHSPDPIEEFILISNPDGLLTLETELLENWDPFHSDLAIKRFTELIKDLQYKFRTPYFFKSHQSITPRLLEISEEFINSLVDFSHQGIWYGINDVRQKIGNKINRMAGRRLMSFYQKEMFMSFPREKFVSLTRNYLQAIIDAAIENDKSYYVIMEPYVSLNVNRILNFFHSAKIIVVKRDPRDAFINLQKVQTDYFPVENVVHFITCFKALQLKFEEQKLESNENLLVLNFEDIVLNYDATISKILHFLGIAPFQHIHRKKFFNPEHSIKNLRTFEKYTDRNTVQKISVELEAYCYNF